MSKPKRRKSHHVHHSSQRAAPGAAGRVVKRTEPVAVVEEPEEPSLPADAVPPKRGDYGAPPGVSVPTPTLTRDQWGAAPNTVALAAVDPPRTLPANRLIERTRQSAISYVGDVRHAVGEVRPWLRSGLQRDRAPTGRSVRVLLSLTLALGLLLGVAGSGIGAIADYVALKGLATSAIDSLNRVPEDLGLGSKTPGTHLIGDAQKAQAAADLQAALRDFQALHDRLVHPDPLLSLGGHVTRVADYMQSGIILSDVAIDGIHIAQHLLDSLVVLANALNTSALVGSTGTTGDTGGVTVAQLGALQTNITAALPYITDLIARLNAQSPAVTFAALSANQRAKITPYLSLLPKIPQFLPIMDQFIAAAPAILGIGQPAGYLIMTMDPSEIRPSGGFQGNYAVMAMDAGRPGSLSLQDVYLLDKPYQATDQGANDAPPPQYLNWWPSEFLPWGLRDANLAANFPTTAAYNLSELQKEGGAVAPITDGKGNVTGTKPVTVTGFVAVEPAVIAQFLALAGPITIGAPYNETVTADNLQDKIHYYQLTNAGRKVGTTVGSGDTVSSANKRFTALIAKAVQARIKTLPKEVLLQYISQLVDDLHTKDIQIAFTNPTAENFLRYYQISSEMYLGKADSLAINNTNISGNKASTYLHEVIHDAVQLDRTGGATHTLTIDYTWAPPPIQDGTNADQVYNVLYNADSYNNFGLYYRQFTRIYTADQPNVQSAAGWQFGGIDHFTSDVPGRGMLGAYYILQGDATTHPVSWVVPSATVTWYVPNVYTPGKTYELHFGRQAGTSQSLSVSVTPPTCSKGGTQTFTRDTASTDAIFTMPVAAC